MILILIGVVVFAWMLVEARRAARNERAQRARGGIEPADDVYRVMRIAYPASFLAMLAEGAVRGPAGGGWLAAGLAVFVAAKTIKWWAILTLDRAWTFRVIVVPGAPLVAAGPYRYLRHPNYVGVIGELVATAMMTNANVTGPAAVILFGILLYRRIAVEERTLKKV
jgi:methyltransferase